LSRWTLTTFLFLLLEADDLVDMVGNHLGGLVDHGTPITGAGRGVAEGAEGVGVIKEVISVNIRLYSSSVGHKQMSISFSKRTSKFLAFQASLYGCSMLLDPARNTL